MTKRSGWAVIPHDKNDGEALHFPHLAAALSFLTAEFGECLSFEPCENEVNDLELVCDGGSWGTLRVAD